MRNLNDSIKAKIQKLLTLAKDGTDEESQTAMLHARKLMLKHNIQESDLVPNFSVKKIVVNEKVYRNKLIWWHRKLAYIIAEHFRCSYYRNTIDTYQSEIRFVGLEKDVQIASMIYNFARASIHYHSQIFLKRPEIKRKWKRKHQFKNDYIKGYLAGLNRKFYEQNKAESLELAVVQDALVVQYFNSLSLISSNIPSPKTAGDDIAWKNGYNDGQKFERGREMLEVN